MSRFGNVTAKIRKLHVLLACDDYGVVLESRNKNRAFLDGKPASS